MSAAEGRPSRGERYYLAKINAPCEGSIRCLDCDSEWKGYATAASAEALCDVLNSMLWEHHVGVPHIEGCNITPPENGSEVHQYDGQVGDSDA